MEPFDLRQWPGYVKAGGNMSSPAIVNQVLIDTRRLETSDSLFIALKGTLDGHHFISDAANKGCRYALVKKEWQAPNDFPETIQMLRVDDPLSSFQEIAAAYRKNLNIPILAIIGSYGKTMVKDFLFKILECSFPVGGSPESFNSQIGVPLSLFTLNSNQKLGIIEAAFSKPDEMRILANLLDPTYAILTHIGKRHLSTMGSIESIAKECTIFLERTKKWVVLPKVSLLESKMEAIKGEMHFWNEQSIDLPHARFTHASQSGKMAFEVVFPDGVRYLGSITNGFYYFIDLVNMTIKAAWLMGSSSEKICKILQEYVPESMRTEIWKSPIGTTFINDVYCSDPQSIDVALKHFELAPPNSRRIFIFHGMRGDITKLPTDYKRIDDALQQTPVHQLILIGKHPYEPLLENTRLRKHETTCYETLQEAYSKLRPNLKQDDVVLIKGERKQHLDSITEAFNDSITNNQCIINLAAIASNISAIKRKLAEGTRVMIMVKALAYGTDDLRMAGFLTSCGIDILGVSYVDEGVALKRRGIETAIFVINAGVYEAAKIVKWDLEVGVSEYGIIEAIEKEAKASSKCIKVHLHVNTGMSRLGCRPEDALSIAKRIVSSDHLQLEGIMTHFACSESPLDDDFTLSQVFTFDQVIDMLKNHGITPPWKHAANSSGAIRFNFPQYNMVRIGLAVYGLHASAATRQCLELRLAFSLISRVVGINTCRNGESVSYGRSYKVSKEIQKIAVLPIGYFDGLHRNYSGKGSVIIRGCKAPMVGNITMDYMMVDVTEVPCASIGDPVLLFGEDEYGHYMSPEEFANQVDSIPHELITCLGPRIHRIFVYEEACRQKNNTTGVCHGFLSETASSL